MEQSLGLVQVELGTDAQVVVLIPYVSDEYGPVLEVVGDEDVAAQLDMTRELPDAHVVDDDSTAVPLHT